MPRYYFNLRDDREIDDEEGVELADEAAAREVALANVRELACADIRQGWLNLDHRIEVRDGAGDLVTTIRFRDGFEFRD